MKIAPQLHLGQLGGELHPAVGIDPSTATAAAGIIAPLQIVVAADRGHRDQGQLRCVRTKMLL